MSKTCSIGSVGDMASAPNLLPRPEKSSVRDSMQYAQRAMKQRAVAQGKQALVKRAAPVQAPSKGAKQFDEAMSNPALKNLGL